MIKETINSNRQADCVTEVCIGNTTLVIYGFLNSDATETAEDKLLKVLKSEIQCINNPASIA